eukprot:scaffold28540_cov15-Prasinocladus_malaysianus.AAC.1
MKALVRFEMAEHSPKKGKENSKCQTPAPASAYKEKNVMESSKWKHTLEMMRSPYNSIFL